MQIVVSPTGFSAGFPADWWARKNENSFFCSNAERRIPQNPSHEGFLLLPNLPKECSHHLHHQF